MHQLSDTPAAAPNQGTPLQTIPSALARWLRADLLVLLLIFVVLHYFKLANFLLSIDDEYEALRTTGFNWILTGRWSAYLFLRYLVPQPIVPFFPAFLFGLGIVLSYPLLLACFGVKRVSPVHYLAFPLYAGFPTWEFLNSLTTASCWAGVAQLVTVFALHRYRRTLDLCDAGFARHRVPIAANATLCILVLAVTMGFYQAYLLSFVALGLGVVLVINHGSEYPLKRAVVQGALLGVLTILGILVHGMVDLAFRRAFGLTDMRYIEGFLNLHALFASPLAVIGQTIHGFADTYAGRASVYGIDSITFPLIIVSGLAAVASWRAPSLTTRLVSLATAIGVLVAPFVLHVFNGGLMPLRTLVAIPAVFWLFSLLGLTSRVRAIAVSALIVSALGVVQIIYASNLYYAASHFARIHDTELASAVYARIAEQNPTFDSKKTYVVDFFGARPFATKYPRPLSSTAGFSFFEWDGGNEDRILQYMTLIGYTNLRAPSLEQRRRDVAEFEHMPTWPARDSVRVVGDVTLIKLGDAPGFPLNRP